MGGVRPARWAKARAHLAAIATYIFKPTLNCFVCSRIICKSQNLHVFSPPVSSFSEHFLNIFLRTESSCFFIKKNLPSKESADPLWQLMGDCFLNGE